MKHLLNTDLGVIARHLTKDISKRHTHRAEQVAQNDLHGRLKSQEWQGL